MLKTVKIAKDTPGELLKLAQQINFSKVPKEQISSKIEQLKQVANRYGIPRRIGKVDAIEIQSEAPQELATLISQMDFSKYAPMIRTLAIGFMRNYLKNEGLLK